MIALNLEVKTPEQIVLKNYLEQNASDVLAEKINNGVPIEKDGRTLTNKKTLDGFLSYACEEARKLAEKGARSACIEDKTVFGWAIHYFEEDSIEGALYNADGSAYKPPKPKYEPRTATAPVTPTAPKPKPQMSLFDFMELNEKDNVAEVKDKAVKPVESDEDDDGITSEEEQREILRELAEEEARQQEIDDNINIETGEILTEAEMRKFDGDVEEPKDVPKTAFKVVPKIVGSNINCKLSELLGNILIAR